MLLAESDRRRASRIVLGAFLVAVLAAAMTYSRGGGLGGGGLHGGWLEGEATYLLQAESLARDGDLAFSRQDFDRFVLAHQGEPPDLALASGSAGRRIAYDRPFPYALWLAPFVRLMPERGFAVANAVALAAAAAAAVWALEAVVGATASLVVAMLVFGSVAFGYVFLATGDLFLMVLSVIAWSLVAAPSATGRPRRWLAAALLLSVLVATEPLYGVLVVGAFVAAPRAAKGALLLGLGLGLSVQTAVQWWWSGGLHFFASQRFRFTPETGFPLVDFAAEAWSTNLKHLSAFHWDEAPRFGWGVDPLLWLWDGLYLVAGRNIGLLPYFPALVLILAAMRGEAFRRALSGSVAAWLVGIVVLHPFDLFGGEGAIANRLFLPVYGAAWLLIARRPPIAAIATAAVLGGLFLMPLWSSPWRHPIDPGGGYSYPSAVAERVLPFETSQRRIPGGRLADLPDGLRLELLNDGVWWESRRQRLALDAARRAELVVASREPLAAVRLELGADAPSAVEVRGARLGKRVLRPDGGLTVWLQLGWPARRHAQWWSPDRHWLYPLRLELEKVDESAKTLYFELAGEAAR